jgi:hypothetical protein
MTKEGFIELQKMGKPMRLDQLGYPIKKPVSSLMRVHEVTFDTIAVLAKEHGIDNIKDENSMLPQHTYRKINELLAK